MSVWDTLIRLASRASVDHALTTVEAMQAAHVPQPTSRGFRTRGGGASTVLSAAPEFRGTSRQVCGLYPFGVGSGTPMKGAPLGKHQDTQATVCCDPISWFQDGKFISNPSAFILGLVGLGKSTIIRRWIIALAAAGVIPLVLGDTKPDHVDAIRAIGGEVITVGPGQDFMNILDPGTPGTAIAQLEAAAAAQEHAARTALDTLPSLIGDDEEAAWAVVREAEAESARLRRFAREIRDDAHARRLTMVMSLIMMARGAAFEDNTEESMVSAALRVLDDRLTDRAPILPDLLAVIREGHPRVRAMAYDDGDDASYRLISRKLEASLARLCSADGAFGLMFANPTSTAMPRDRPVVYDTSALAGAPVKVSAAAQMACWANGFAAIHVSQVLAEAGLEPQHNYLVVMDELWRTLEAGAGIRSTTGGGDETGIVDSINALTRLNRQIGVGTVMATHSMEDLDQLPTEAQCKKARGFIKRAGMVILGGLPREDMPQLNGVIGLSHTEQAVVSSWTTPAGWDPAAAPPGRGHFLIKVGGKPGVPIVTQLTALEHGINETNHRWHKTATSNGVPA